MSMKRLRAKGQVIGEFLVWCVVLLIFSILMLASRRFIQPLCDLKETFQSEREGFLAGAAFRQPSAKASSTTDIAVGKICLKR